MTTERLDDGLIATLLAAARKPVHSRPEFSLDWTTLKSLCQEVEQSRATIAAIRDIHHNIDGNCSSCIDEPGGYGDSYISSSYPCETIQALDLLPTDDSPDVIVTSSSDANDPVLAMSQEGKLYRREAETIPATYEHHGEQYSRESLGDVRAIGYFDGERELAIRDGILIAHGLDSDHPLYDLFILIHQEVSGQENHHPGPRPVPRTVRV